MAVQWKIMPFGTLIASVLFGGLLLFLAPEKKIVTTVDKAFLFDRYQGILAVAGEWPFTTNPISGSAWGMDITNIPPELVSWNWSAMNAASGGTAAVFGVHVPAAAIHVMMEGLPRVCTNFVRCITTNSNGGLVPVYWDWPSLAAHCGVGDGASWTVAYGTNGVPIYSNAPVSVLCTTLFWEIWRVETNLCMTTRPAAEVGEYRAAGVFYYLGDPPNDNTITNVDCGAWEQDEWGWIVQLPSYSDFAEPVRQAATDSPPHEILFPEAFTEAGINSLGKSAGTWDMTNSYRNWHRMVDGTFPPPALSANSRAGEYYWNDEGRLRHFRYQRKFRTQYPSGLFEGVYSGDPPTYQGVYVKTNLYSTPIASFPSGTVVEAHMLVACILNWTNATGNILATTNVTPSASFITRLASGAGYNGPTNGTVFPGVDQTDSSAKWKLYYDGDGYYVILQIPPYDLGWGDNVFALPDTMAPFDNAVGTFVLDYETYSTTLIYHAEGTVIRDRVLISTGVTERIEFLGDLSTNVFTNLTLSVSPTLQSALSREEQWVSALFRINQSNAVTWSEDNGTFDETERFIQIAYSQSNAFLEGSCVETGAPLAVLRWTFPAEYEWE